MTSCTHLLITQYPLPINMPEAAATKGKGRPAGLKNGEGKPMKPEAPATHTMKTRGK